MKESTYVAGNITEKLINVGTSIGEGVHLGTQLGGSNKLASTLRRIAFKVTKDVTRGNTVYTGLYAISGTCEELALSCSIIKIISY